MHMPYGNQARWCSLRTHADSMVVGSWIAANFLTGSDWYRGKVDNMFHTRMYLSKLGMRLTRG